MNIHPAFVHFPIALLVVYALIELLPLARFLPAVHWDVIRRFTLYTGTAFSIPTLITGFMAAQVIGEIPAVETHEAAAFLTVAIFFALSGMAYFWRAESGIKYWLTKAFALAGFIMLFVTSALGANIVYGSSVDPIVSFVVKVLGVQ